MAITETNTSNRSTSVTTPNSSAVTTTSSRSTIVSHPNRQAIIHTLAVVGFIALIGASMWLAVYSTRYVPGVVNRIGTAAVYLGSVFTPAPKPSLSIVPTPTASTTIFFGTTSTTTSTSTTSKNTKPTPSKSVSTTPGEKTTTTYQIGGTGTGVLSGLPDLTVNMRAVGYLATTSADSFVASTTVPADSRAAISFTIKNIGTNVSGPWCFSVTIPTASFYLYESQPQQSLAPGDSIDYTLGFDRANRGVDQMISVTANTSDTSNTATCASAITESTKDNNSAFAKITVR